MDRTRSEIRRNEFDTTQIEIPEITTIATKFVPKNNPKIYLRPVLQPYAAPTPAAESTPGPGVMIKKKTAKAKLIIIF